MQKRKFVKVPMHEIIVDEVRFEDVEENILYAVARSPIWGHLSKKGRFVIRFKVGIHEEDRIIFLTPIEAYKVENGKPPLPKDRLEEIVLRIAKKVKKAHPELFQKWLDQGYPVFKWERESDEKSS